MPMPAKRTRPYYHGGDDVGRIPTRAQHVGSDRSIVNETMVSRRLARAGKLAGTVLGIALLAACVLPPLVATPVAHWLVSHLSTARCGSFAIRRAHLGWSTAFRLMAGRPVVLTLQDVAIASPSGERVFAAAHIEAKLALGLMPPRIERASVQVADGTWRLAMEGADTGLANAFRALPAEGRQACLAPSRIQPPSAPPTETTPVHVNLRVVNLDVRLEFDTWALALTHVAALGSVSVNGPLASFLFDAREISAASSRLRIGEPHGHEAVEIPFDTVAITRVGVLPSAPTDLLLEVRVARTARARLSGRAVFTGLFPRPGRAAPETGIRLDARWAHFGDVLGAAESTWLPHGPWTKRFDGELAAAMNGPWKGLHTTVSFRGQHGQLRAQLGPRGRGSVALHLADVETGWMLDPALRPFLTGHLGGNLDARFRLAGTVRDSEAEIGSAELHLDRASSAPGPRVVELRIGRAGRAESSARRLAASVAVVRLHDGTVKLGGARFAWTGIAGRADVAIALPMRSRRGSRSAWENRSVIDAHGSVRVASPHLWNTTLPATATLHVLTTVRGTLKALQLGVQARPATIAAFDQRFHLPPKIEAQWSAAEGWRLEPVRLRRDGGGKVELSGRISANGEVDGRVRMRDYPLAALPAPAHASALRALGGTLDGEMELGGDVASPTAEGRLSVENATVEGHAIGPLAARGRLGRRHGFVVAKLGPATAATVSIERRPSLAVRARLRLDRQPVNAWLPAPLGSVPLLASGTATVAYRRGKAVLGTGRFEVRGPHGLDLLVDGKSRNRQVEGRIRGSLDLASWQGLLRPHVTRATGTLHLDARVERGPGFPSVHGSAVVAKDVALGLSGWRAPLTIAAGGSVTLDGDDVTTLGLDVRAAGVRAHLSGHAHVERDQIAETEVGVAVSADLDTAALPFDVPGVRASSGHVRVQGTVDGPLASPRLDGRAAIDDLALRLSRPALPRLRVRGQLRAQDSTLSTEGLAAQIAGVGTLHVGTPTTPAHAEMLSLIPFTLGRVDVPLDAEHLRLGSRTSALRIADLSARARLVGDARSELRLVGEITVAHASYDVRRGTAVRTKSETPWFHLLPPRLTLDLDVRGANHALAVDVPFLPDVAVDFHCRLVASHHGADWTGEVKGDSLYSRAALAAYDWLSSSDLAGCGLPARR